MLTATMMLVACSSRQDAPTVTLPDVQLWHPADRSVTPSAAEAQRRIALSVWGVTPGSSDTSMLRQPLQGSAIAVAGGWLLVACDAARGQNTVGVARRSSVRRAAMHAADADRRLCLLRVPDVEMTTVRAYRPFEDVQVGEPLLAVSSETSRRFALSRGRLVAKGSTSDPYLETTLMVPQGSSSVAVFDTFGNLLGFGTPNAMPGSLLVAFPIPPAAVPWLAGARIADSPAVRAVLEPAPPGAGQGTMPRAPSS
jgi:hypothetical protein